MSDGRGARGQLSLPVVEATVAAALVLGVTAGFTVGVDDPDRDRARLERYANDGVTVLASDPATDAPRLDRAVAGPDRFRERRDELRNRTAELLPDSVLFRLRTPVGTVGRPRPPGVPIGRATVTTAAGPVTLEVWYA